MSFLPIWAQTLVRALEDADPDTPIPPEALSLFRRARPTDYTTRRLPPKPTFTIPGTPERIAVYMDRLSKKQALHHPDDLKTDDIDYRLGRLAVVVEETNGHAEPGELECLTGD